MRQRFSIRRWIEGCEAVWRRIWRVVPVVVSVSADGSKGVKRVADACFARQLDGFSIRRWIEGCEAYGDGNYRRRLGRVSVSADGSKGVKPSPIRLYARSAPGFSIRRWIEGCEARQYGFSVQLPKCFSIRRWIEGCEAFCGSSATPVCTGVSVSADGSKGVKRSGETPTPP